VAIYYDTAAYSSSDGLAACAAADTQVQNAFGFVNSLFAPHVYQIAAAVTGFNPKTFTKDGIPVGSLINFIISGGLDTPGTGAFHAYGFADIVTGIGSIGNTAANLGYCMVAEISEDFMGVLSGLTQEDEYVFGEGLSQCMALLAYPGVDLTFYNSPISWLNAPYNYTDYTSGNWLQTDATNGVLGISCNIHFINWLRALGFTFAEIFTAINSLPNYCFGAQVWNKLGRTGNPFATFLTDVHAKIPAGTFPYSVSSFKATFPGGDLWQTPVA
jgi:hypothetical protein